MCAAHARPQNDDDLIEHRFIIDYAALGLLINFRSLDVLLKTARRLPANGIDRKSVSLSAYQALLSGFEDFAILLHAILRKHRDGQHLHRGLGFARQQRQGSTDVPGILKRYNSAREYLDALGFNSVDLAMVRRFGLDIPDQQTFEDYYRDFAEGVRHIGDLQRDYNDLKNRLKHGKAVLSNGPQGITFLTWDDRGGQAGWNRTHIETTLRLIKVAVAQTAKIYLRSLDFLLAFMMQYHPQHVAEFQAVMLDRGRWCVRKVKALKLRSKGLTNI
jgi:hypothetical protein